MQCAALRKNGHPCRGYANKATGLCHMHTDFFKGDRPYKIVEEKASIFQTPTERGWLIQMVQSPHFRWDPAYEKRLQELYTSPQWWMRDRSLYIYDIWVRAGKICPRAPTKLWQARVRQQFSTICYCSENVELPRILHTLLTPYFRFMSPITSITLLLDCTRSVPGMAMQPDASGAMWNTILNEVAKIAPMRPFALFPLERFMEGIDVRHPTVPGCAWTRTDLPDRVANFYQEHAALERAKLRLRLDAIREELMAAAWHPRRVAAALEAGYEIEDL